MTLLGIDPSLTNTGVVALNPSEDRITRVEVIQTEKRADRLNLRVGEDDLRRAQNIHQALARIVDEENAMAVFGELPGGTQSSRASKGFGLVLGVIASYLDANDVPAAWATQYEIKKAATGDGRANKDEVEAFARERWTWDDDLPSAKTRREHVFDAAAALHALQDSDVYRMAVRALP